MPQKKKVLCPHCKMEHEVLSGEVLLLHIEACKPAEFERYLGRSAAEDAEPPQRFR